MIILAAPNSLKFLGNQKSNVLEGMRFLAALLVIVSHAFTLSTRNSEVEWLSALTDNAMGLGAVTVTLFFLCGGYLIAKSMERMKTFSAFWKARIKRLFPALIFVVTVTVFCGALLTDLTAAEYFS